MEWAKNVTVRFSMAVAVTALSLFLPAWSVIWWQAWVYLALFFIPMALISLYLVRCNQELLKRRLETKETRPKQGVIAYLFYASLGITFMLSGLDRRFGWSDVPMALEISAAIVFLAGYYFLFLVFKTNRFLAHTVRVEEGQVVVTTDPYAVVRHPMYLAELIMFIATPLMLGSYWALLSDVMLIALLVARIVTEEDILLNELKGYGDYTRKTRYRLVPFIW